MANPLSPLSSSTENIRTAHSTVRQTFQSTTSETTRHDESVEKFYDVQEFASSSTNAKRAVDTAPQPTPSRFRFPVKMLTDWISPSQTRSPPSEPTKTLAPPPLEDDDKENPSGRTTAALKSSGVFDPDDTCASAFSMVPTADMTRFARLGESPIRVTPPRSPTRLGEVMTPTSSRTRTPGTAARRPLDVSPTPRRQNPIIHEDTTTQLLDFTETISAGPRSPQRKAAVGMHSPSKSSTSANLLDFDLPPAPTPRSMPSISAREVETLKASFMSQISSLNATINGKDATIQSLIGAKDDAERCQGELSERLTEAEAGWKNLLEEKSDWEKRDNEIKTILRSVKSELVHREKERDEISSRLEESEKAREEAEARIREADAKITGLQTDLQQAAPQMENDGASEGLKTPNKAVEIAVEKVARELHQLYKQKHESKVSALKKSYESRWEKKVRELESRVSDLSRENEELRIGREATMTKVVPGMLPKVETKDAGTSPCSEGSSRDEASAAAHADLQGASAESTAEVARLQAQVESLQSDAAASIEESNRLQQELETARAENSDLVAVVEEMLQLDPNAQNGSNDSAASDAEAATALSDNRPRSGSNHTRSNSQDQFRASGSEYVRPPSRSGIAGPKASGLARPGFGFGGAAAGARSGGAAMRPAGQGVAGRSGIMSSIERMGRGRTGDGQ